ncbi:transglycosylase SLT domain-containing protein [Novosphingobium terrae]|uniref:transglycosylase SLT domain-containing protein n=1 Tax=Novosphingobium terrae TaxID=2726189 RepID=UPI001F1404CD|nr:transglycosylase SLT domain-containing protein [Novosphingobium terrae]
MSQPDLTGAQWAASIATDPSSQRDASRAAIARAAGASGVDFNYLLAQAKLESSLDPRAQAATSSARGLYQFTNATWLNTLQKHGSMLGLSGASVADPMARAQMMAMRDDPNASAMMAAGLAGDNQVALTNALGRTPDASELYLAHFLGAEGATKFLSAMAADPTQSAAAINPKAAASNQAIFFAPGGMPRSLGQVMDLLRGKMTRAMNSEDGNFDPLTTANYGAYGGGVSWAEATVPAPLPDPATMGGPLARQFAAARDGDFAASSGNGSGAGDGGNTRLSMADTLQNVFGGGGDGSAAPAAVRAAYGRLKSMGL